MADRKWKKAVVTYTGGKSYSVGSKTFKQNRPITISDKALVDGLINIKGFTVEHFWEDEAPAPVAPAPVVEPPEVKADTPERTNVEAAQAALKGADRKMKAARKLKKTKASS